MQYGMDRVIILYLTGILRVQIIKILKGGRKVFVKTVKGLIVPDCDPREILVWSL